MKMLSKRLQPDREEVMPLVDFSLKSKESEDSSFSILNSSIYDKPTERIYKVLKNLSISQIIESCDENGNFSKNGVEFKVKTVTYRERRATTTIGDIKLNYQDYIDLGRPNEVFAATFRFIWPSK